MIIYGDPQMTVTLGEAVARFRDLLRTGNRNPLDHLRSILILSGQMEQAVEDCASLDDERKRIARELTNEAARNFLREFEQTRDRLDESDRFEALLDGLSQGAPQDVLLTLKVPEGFAFYALYPEQYHATSKSWVSAHSSAENRSALVLGLRSIGTTLSAVVATTLRQRGWQVTRVTARPSGHPFSRQMEIAPEVTAGMSYALVVDEGPGLSGSSFAAAAEALLRNGFAADKIFFFPSHPHEPGLHSPPHVREIWERIPRYIPAADNKFWNGKTAPEVLCQRASAQSNTSVSALHDIGGGKWREFAFSSPSQWTAVAPAFERPKFLLEMSDGTRLLWKFTRLSNPYPVERCASPFRRPPMLDTCLGYTLFSWIEGERLQLAEMDSQFAARLGQHINQSALPFDEAEQRQYFQRLRQMAEFNTRESLGDVAVARLEELSKLAEEIQTRDVPCYGDGRLAPHEFIRTASGEIFKVDEDGPYGDHTIIGPQPILWDIAGAIIEWNMNECSANALLKQIPSEDKYKAALPFYCASYAAFRAGLLLFNQSEDAPSAERVLRGAADFYLNALESCLGSNEPSHLVKRAAIQSA
jgi:hypothetical protein